jgi:SulP family sulfate permease
MRQRFLTGAQPALWRSAGIGIVLGVDAVASCIALATICFATVLPVALGVSTAAMLLATVVIALVLAWRSGFSVALGIAQDTSVALLAPAVALATTQVSGPVEARVVTAMAVIGASALLSGVVFWLVGRLRLGRVVRLFPYPVAAGFLAASGGILILSALRILTNAVGYSDFVANLAQPVAQANLGAGVVLGFGLMVMQGLRPGANSVLICILAAFGLFYLALMALGIDFATAKAVGLLPEMGQNGQGVSLNLSSLGLIDWGVVAMAAPTLTAVAMIGLIGVLLNISGVELATRQDVDTNHELRITGLVNVAVGLFGGITSYLQGGGTMMAHRLGVDGRVLAISYAAVAGVACLFAAQIVAVVPVFVAAGLLLFIGLSMVQDWLVGSWRQLLAGDRALVLLITATALGFGVLPAIGLGLALAVLGFAVAYARLPVVRQMSDAARQPSVVDRVSQEADLLATEGARIRIMHLQGALFFGSADQVSAQLTDLSRVAPISAIILNFADVQSVDSAACAALGKLGQMFGRQGIGVHLTHVSPAFRRVFDRWGLALAEGEVDSPANLRLWPRLDDAVQHCEDALLADLLGPDRPVRMHDLLTGLSAVGDRPDRIAALAARMQLIELTDGAELIRAGAQSEDVFILEQGRLGVYLDQPGGTQLRVRVMAPGALVGEVAHLLAQPRIAHVRAEGRVRIWRMSAKAMAGLTAQDADLLALWNGILARALAQKIIQTNRLLTRFRG